VQLLMNALRGIEELQNEVPDLPVDRRGHQSMTVIDVKLTLSVRPHELRALI
jgi:hypothetical protein